MMKIKYSTRLTFRLLEQNVVVVVVFRFGRKRTLCVSSIFYLVSALSIAWTPSYQVYLVLIFAMGFFSVGNFMSAFVMGEYDCDVRFFVCILFFVCCCFCCYLLVVVCVFVFFLCVCVCVCCCCCCCFFFFFFFFFFLVKTYFIP